MTPKVQYRRRTVVMAIVCVMVFAGVAAGQAAGGNSVAIVLEPMLVAPAGTEAVFYIEEFSSQEVVDVGGFFTLVDPTDMEEYSYAAAIVHYTMLEPRPGDDAPRLLVHAVAYDPESEEIMHWLRWTATYALFDDGARQLDGDVVPDEYVDLVKPGWLTDWSIVAPADRPHGPVQVGDEWRGAANIDYLEIGEVFDRSDLSAFGTFVGWTNEVGGDGAAALVSEQMTGGGSGLMELADGLHAIAAVDVDGLQEYWLVPGMFPDGMNGLLVGDMSFTVGPETGAPPGLEGYVNMSMYYDTYIERHPTDVFPWWVFDETAGPATDTPGMGAASDVTDTSGDDGFLTLTAERPASGVLGPWSDELDDGTYADFYALFADAGQRAVLELHSSDFDAYMFLFDDVGNLLAVDDDSAGDGDARIEVTLPYSGLYVVVANTYFPGESGLYVLTLDWADPFDVDFDRAVQLIGLLSVGYPLDDAELAEAESLLEKLLYLVQSQR